MNDRPLLELADYLQRQAHLYGPTKDSDRHHRDWAATRTRQAVILRAADAVVEAVFALRCNEGSDAERESLEDALWAAHDDYEAACRQEKEHE